MEEKIIRPTTKPEAIKGKLLKYQGTDYCEFLPQSQGEPQYEGISKTRNSQLKVLNRVFPKATVKVMRNNALEQDVKSWFAEVPASD